MERQWTENTFGQRRYSKTRKENGTRCKELARYNIDIAALSETRFPDEGSLTELTSGYTFFWKGKAQTKVRIHGVGLAIKTSLLKNLPDLPMGINERLMKIRLPLNDKRYVTVISAYAPTLTSAEETIEHFYANLSSVLRLVPASDKLILLGDFNARVGQDHTRWEGVLDKHGVGKTNSNGLLLLSKCAEFEILITNTIFRMVNMYKTTWMHPRSKQWHMIDYIIVRQRDIRDVLVTRAMRGADCWTDHRLVRVTLQLHIVPHHPRHAKVIRSAFNIVRLQDPSYLHKFQSMLDEKLSANGSLIGNGNPTEKWNQFRDVVTETAKETLGPKERTHQDWFDENESAIGNLLGTKNKAFLEWQKDPGSASKKERFKSLQSQAQREIRKMKDQWWEKAEEIQHYADINNARQFFGSLKAVYGPSKSGFAPLLSAECATLIKDKQGINNRWR